MATGLEVMRKLMERGLSPVQAAALTGHSMQESSLNPSAYNPKEDAFGLIQHRLDRLANLRNFAKQRGAGADDLETQLDFILKEMHGPEAKAGSAFLSAKDLPSAHAALKRFIRYGDNSDAARLGNAQALLGGGAATDTRQPIAAPFSMAAASSPIAAASPLGLQMPGAAQPAAAQAPAPVEDELIQPVPIQMAKPLGLAAVRRLLAAMKEA